MWIGTGSSIEFQTGFFAEVLDIKPPAPTREPVQTSHMLTTTAHTYMPVELVDWQELVVEMAFEPSVELPMNEEPEEVVITFDDSGDTTWTFQGFMTKFEPSVPLENRCTGTATIKVTGAVSVG